nr:MAG TPA: hypothetical protein [Caudoviricetes sp.]
MKFFIAQKINDRDILNDLPLLIDPSHIIPFLSLNLLFSFHHVRTINCFFENISNFIFLFYTLKKYF